MTFPILVTQANGTPTAEGWQRAKVRVGTGDLRIAAICIDHRGTLATRNARDDVRVPGLTFDLWN